MRISINYIFLLFLMILISIFIGCREVPKESANEPPVIVVSGFETFYEHFHSDTAYQLSHIRFPLEGMPSYADGEEVDISNFRWQKEDWVIHKKMDDEDFEVRFEVFDESLITEIIKHRSKQVALVRRFAKSDGEWFLIYYSGLNPLRKK